MERAEPTPSGPARPSPRQAMMTTCAIAAILIVLAFGPIGVFSAVFIAPTVVLVGIGLGLPLYDLARRHGRANGWTAAAAGAITAAILPTLTMIGAGEEQVSAWIPILALAIGGAAMGRLFLVLLDWPAHWSARLRKLAFPATAVVLAYALFATSILLREQPKQIGSVAMLELHLASSELPDLLAELAGFARERGWPITAEVQTGGEMPWFRVTTGPESGTHISFSHHPVGDGYVSIAIFQPQGGKGWQAQFRALQDRLEARWPGKVSEDSPQPPWAPTSPSPTPAPSSAVR